MEVFKCKFKFVCDGLLRKTRLSMPLKLKLASRIIEPNIFNNSDGINYRSIKSNILGGKGDFRPFSMCKTITPSNGPIDYHYKSQNQNYFSPEKIFVSCPFFNNWNFKNPSWAWIFEGTRIHCSIRILFYVRSSLKLFFGKKIVENVFLNLQDVYDPVTSGYEKSS